MLAETHKISDGQRVNENDLLFSSKVIVMQRAFTTGAFQFELV
jgi:hypothetical protein